MLIAVTKLKELLDLMKPVINKKATLPVLKFIKMGDGKAVATDLEVMIIRDLSEATEPMLLPHAALSDVVKYIPGINVNIEAKDGKVFLTWDGGSANYPTEKLEEFPMVGEMTSRGEGELDADRIVNAMAAAMPYTAEESTRAVLTGVTLVLGNPIEVAAGDGFTMSHQILPLSFPAEEKIIIPAHAVAVMAHVLLKIPRNPPSGGDSLIPILVAKRMAKVSLLAREDEIEKVSFDLGSASVMIKLIAGKPPEWLALIPKGEPILQSTIFALQLEAAVKRVKSIVDGKKGDSIVRVVFADGKITLSTSAAEEGEISTTINAVHTMGEPGRTALNYNYLLRYLAGKQGVITLSQFEGTGPISFEYGGLPKVLIMPMAVKWGDEPVEETPAAAEATVAENETEEPTSETEESSDETKEGSDETEPVETSA